MLSERKKVWLQGKRVVMKWQLSSGMAVRFLQKWIKQLSVFNPAENFRSTKQEARSYRIYLYCRERKKRARERGMEGRKERRDGREGRREGNKSCRALAPCILDTYPSPCQSWVC